MMRKYLTIIGLLGIAGLIGASGALATDDRGDGAASLDDMRALIDDNALAISDLQEQIGFLATLELGTVDVPAFTGTHCVVAWFAHPFATPPRVFITANHRRHVPPTTHQPITVWIENIGRDRFRVCVREVVGDDIHDEHVMVDWLAIE